MGLEGQRFLLDRCPWPMGESLDSPFLWWDGPGGAHCLSSAEGCLLHNVPLASSPLWKGSGMYS